MEKRLFVGNLPYTVSEGELEDAFAQFGTVVSVNVIRDRDTGRSRGFAFVEMQTEAEAEKAQSAADGMELDNRRLRVNEAQPRRGGGNGGGSWGSRW